jgi:hypothetical protein
MPHPPSPLPPLHHKRQQRGSDPFCGHQHLSLPILYNANMPSSRLLKNVFHTITFFLNLHIRTLPTLASTSSSTSTMRAYSPRVICRSSPSQSHPVHERIITHQGGHKGFIRSTKPQLAAWVWLYDVKGYWMERIPTMHPMRMLCHLSIQQSHNDKERRPTCIPLRPLHPTTTHHLLRACLHPHHR